MNVIVDTEVLIWIQTEDKERLVTSNARQYLLNNQYKKWISEVSLFEVAIELKIGKLREFKITLPYYIQRIQQDDSEYYQSINSILLPTTEFL